jgi:Lysozyme like domain
MKWLVAGVPVLWFLSLMVGWAVQPWAPFWFGQQTGAITVQPGAPFDPPGIPLEPPVITGSRVSDAERYQLALAVGFTTEQAITATAISIAEDGSGDPAIMSPQNSNGTYDLGLWQINSSHWKDYGGPQALTVPINNARAAFGIAGPHLNWCAWSTYERSCGRGYTGAYANFLACARAIAAGGTCRR